MSRIDFTKLQKASDLEIARKEALKGTVAERRYREEIRGIEVNGFNISTTRESQTLLYGAALAGFLDADYSCRWKSADRWVILDAKQLVKLSQAVREHVQECFEREYVLHQAIDDGSFTVEMLDVGW